MNKKEKLPALTRLKPSDSRYPAALSKYLSDRPPETLTTLGNVDILQQQKLALFCSVKCPGALILQTYDLARALRDAGVTLIGGFHSPLEQNPSNWKIPEHLRDKGTPSAGTTFHPDESGEKSVTLGAGGGWYVIINTVMLSRGILDAHFAALL